MSRPLRVEYPGAWYHVFNRGRPKENIFFKDDDFRLFFQLIEEATRLYKLEVHAYTLMPDHYHLLIRTPAGNLSEIMRYINGTYTQKINRKYSYEGSMFRGRYKSILIEEDGYLLELIRYIHRNPLNAGIEKRPATHNWTSYRAYMRKKDRPNWLKVEQVLSRFDRYEKTALDKMVQFIEESASNGLEQRLRGVKWPSVLGGEDFKEKVKEMLSDKKTAVQKISDHKEYKNKISVEDLVCEIALAYNMKPNIITRKRDPQNVNIKRAIILICRENLRKSSREISNALGGINRSVITRQYIAACRDWEGKEGCFEDIKNIRRCVERIGQKQQNRN